uniref:dodecin n=1 Tax=Cumulibacter manganitolerans TaxID=1884992 RepID=UPI0038993B33
MMSEHTYGISEIVGSSTTGMDDAIKNAVEKAAKTVRGLEWFEVTQVRGHLEEGTVGHYQVTVKIGFRIDD